MKIVNNDLKVEIEEPKPVSKLETWLVVGMTALLVAAALWLVWIGG